MVVTVTNNDRVFMLYVALLIGAITLLVFVVFFSGNVFGQVRTIQPTMDGQLLEDEAFVTFNATYWNGTQAILNETVLNWEASDQIVRLINAIVANDGDVLEDLLVTEHASLEEAEAEIIEENSDDNPDDNDNGGDDPEPEPQEPDPQDNNDTEPIEEPPFEEGGGEPATTIITEGCNNGLGYYKETGPKLCYPLDKISQDPPEGAGFCTALGCPYNPPSKD